MAIPGTNVKADTVTFAGNLSDIKWGANTLFSITGGAQSGNKIELSRAANSRFPMVLKNADGTLSAKCGTQTAAFSAFEISVAQLSVFNAKAERVGEIVRDLVTHRREEHQQFLIFTTIPDHPTLRAEVGKNQEPIVLISHEGPDKISCLLTMSAQPRLQPATILLRGRLTYQVSNINPAVVDQRLLSIFIGFLGLIEATK